MLALMPHMAQAQAAYSPPSLIRPGTTSGQTARWDNALKKWVPTTGVMVDGTGNLVVGGTVTAAGQLLSPYVLPVGSASTLGGFRVGTGLTVDASGILSTASPYTLPAATTTTLGGIIAGAGLSVTPSGTLSTVSSGTVTSVGLTMPGVLFNSVVPGSPVTGAGTLAPTLLTQAANTVLAGPVSGTLATPGFRGLVSTDLPQSPVFSGMLSAALGLTSGPASVSVWGGGGTLVPSATNTLSQVDASHPVLAIRGRNREMGGVHLLDFYEQDGKTPNAYFDQYGSYVTSQYNFIGANPPYIWSPNGDGSLRLNSPAGPMILNAIDFVFTAAGGINLTATGNDNGGAYGFEADFSNYITDSRWSALRIVNAGTETYRVHPQGWITSVNQNPAHVAQSIKLGSGQTANASQVLSATNAVLQSISAAGVEQAAGYNSSDGSAGLTVTVPLAALTAGGTQGSEIFKNGLLTAYTAPR